MGKRRFCRGLVTRPQEDADKTRQRLRDMGFEVIVEPMLDIVPAMGTKPQVAAAISRKPQAVIITSANGIRVFSNYSDERDIRVICVGDSSAEIAKQAGFMDVKSASGDVDDLADLIVKECKAEEGFLLHMAGNVTAGDLQGQLEGQGFEVQKICGYEAVACQELAAGIKVMLANCEIDFVVFYSNRTAKIFEDLLREEKIDYLAKNMEVFSLSKNVELNLQWRNVHICNEPNEDSLMRLIDEETSDKI